jgi:molybdate transport system permease protein
VNHEDLTALGLSVSVAMAATLLASLVGLPLAWLVAKKRFRGAGLVVALASLPLVLPPTVTGYILLEIFGRRALIGRLLEKQLGLVLVFHWSGAVLAAAVTSFPLLFLSARTAFEAVDTNYEQASRLLGCSERAVLRRVTLPLASRGLGVGIVLGFVRALGDFGATLMLAGNVPGRTRTAALALYDATTLGEAARARMLVAVLGLVAVAALWVSGRAARRDGGRPL